MVDPERLLDVLARVTSRLGILDDYAEQDPGPLLGDRVRLGDLKYTFQTTIEACIDAAQHVVADRGLGVPASNAAAFRSLSQADLIDDDLAASMGGAVGFRNVLVHDYAEVDDELVIDNLARRDDLRRFVTSMANLLGEPKDSHPPTPGSADPG